MCIEIFDIVERILLGPYIRAAGPHHFTVRTFQYGPVDPDGKGTPFFPFQKAPFHIRGDLPRRFLINAPCSLHHNLHDAVCKRILRVCFSINGFQCAYNGLFMFRLYTPDVWQVPVFSPFRRHVCHIKNIFQLLARRCRIDQRDALCAAVDPAPHFIPYSYGRTGGCTRPLRIDQELVLERVFAEASRRIHEPAPFLRTACDFLFCFCGKLEYCIIFFRHKSPPYENIKRGCRTKQDTCRI